MFGSDDISATKLTFDLYYNPAIGDVTNFWIAGNSDEAKVYID